MKIYLLNNTLCSINIFQYLIDIIVIHSTLYLRNKLNFWSVHGIMNTLDLLQSKRSPKGFMLTLQENQSIHDSMNRSLIEFSNEATKRLVSHV